MCEAIAKQRLLDQHKGSMETAARFKSYSWKERLYIEEDAPVWFDLAACHQSGIHVSKPRHNKPASVKLLDMGPKLLLSDLSTADQPLLRWRLRVTGNTALELGVVPTCLEVSNNSLHKADSVRGSRNLRCTGFSSQITAGSHLPVKIPVVRGTIVDVLASRGLMQVILFYPLDAQEIKWNREGHPVPAPYQGPRVLRFELEYGDSYDVKLAATCWAKASFEVLHAKRERVSERCERSERTDDMEFAMERPAVDRGILMDLMEVEGDQEEAPSPKLGFQTARSGDMCNGVSDNSSQSLG